MDFSEAWEIIKDTTIFGWSGKLLYTNGLTTTMPLPDYFYFFKVLKNNQTFSKIITVFFMLISKFILTLIIKIKNLIINKFKFIFILILSKVTGIKYAMKLTKCLEIYINNKGLFKYLVYLVNTNSVPSILYSFNKKLFDCKIIQVLFIFFVLFINFNNYSTDVTIISFFFFISVAILWYITYFKEDFFIKYPKLYILFSVFSYLFFICSIYNLIIIILVKLIELFDILKMMPLGSGGPGNNPSGAGGAGGSGGPGGPNNSGSSHYATYASHEDDRKKNESRWEKSKRLEKWLREYYGIHERRVSDPYFHPFLEQNRVKDLPENKRVSLQEKKIQIAENSSENKIIIENYFYYNEMLIRYYYNKKMISKDEAEYLTDKEKKVVFFYYSWFNKK